MLVAPWIFFNIINQFNQYYLRLLTPKEHISLLITNVSNVCNMILMLLFFPNKIIFHKKEKFETCVIFINLDKVLPFEVVALFYSLYSNFSPKLT